MRVIERPSKALNDGAYAHLFRTRLGIISKFLAEVNSNLRSPLDLLAVRNGDKFDYVLKDGAGKVAGPINLIITNGVVTGVEIQMARVPFSTAKFTLSRTGASRAAQMLCGGSPEPTSIRTVGIP
jgi:hypothetical protein